MRFSTLRRAAVLAGCALVLPASAEAITVSHDGGTLLYKAQAGESLSTLLSSTEHHDYESGARTRYLVFGESGGTGFQIDPATGCFPSDQIYGRGVACPFDPQRPIRIEGADGRDAISVFSANEVPDTIPVTLVGHGGNDELKDAYNGQAGRTLTGGAGSDKLVGYLGDDVLDGGDGDDDLDGGDGDDRVLGGAGSDKLSGDGYAGPGADVIDGGPGIDLVGEWNKPSEDFNPKPTVSLDGVANDGRPGEGDQVVAVERFEQYLATDFSGSDAAETFEIRNGGAENAALAGGGGDDKLLAWDGADTVDGGGGDDFLEGGLGADTITGGPGKDTLYGEGTRSFCGGWSCKVPDGDDTIEARDGEVDLVDCGAGDADIARVDAIDRVSGCERVETAGGTVDQSAKPGQGGTTPQGSTGTGTSSGPSGSGAALKLTLVGRPTVRALTAGRLGVKVPCATACRVSATLKLRGKVVAKGSKTLLKAGTASLKLKRSGRAKVRKGKATLVVKVTGASGPARTSSRAVTLR